MSDFYIELDKPKMRQHQPGQIFWVPAPIISATALGMRLGFLKEGQDISDASLSIERLDLKDLCCPKEAEKVEFYKRMPIPEIQLSASEDLLIQKVKMRPAVLLFKSGINMRRFSLFEIGRTSKDVLPNHYIFAPIYSLKKEENVQTDYPEPFIEKVKDNTYPHLQHLPAYKTHLPNESMVVLDDLFGVGIRAFRETPLAIQPLELAAKLEEFFDYVQGEMLLQADESP